MKLLSLFLASSFGQEGDEASDKTNADYGSYGNYGSYNSYGSYPSYSSYGPDAKFINEATENGVNNRLGNGLMCYKCHGRLDLSAKESVTNNAWLSCVSDTTTDTGTVECTGDQRSCLTEERRRNDVVVEVKAMCSNPEACMYQWRRNQRFMPMFHLFGDQTDSANPMFFDDECKVDISSNAASKHLSARSQWESTCRHCCMATTVDGCNGPAGAATEPMGYHCASAALCTAALTSANQFSLYSIAHIQTFMELELANNRNHPGDGRNSLPEDKFNKRMNLLPGLLAEQADTLSPEDTDFHNRRVPLVNVNGAFGT